MSIPDRLSARVITDFRILQQLSSEWADLWNRCPGATPFQRPEWLLSWVQAFQPQELHVIEIRRDGALVGLAPLFLYKAAGEEILAPVGASASDYVDWLVDPINDINILELIFTSLRTSQRNWDRLDVHDLPRSSVLLKLRFDEWDYERSVETACPVLCLPKGLSTVEEILSSKPRHNLRTARRRLERVGQARVEVANRPTLDEFLAAMLRLHGARWTQFGTPGVLADNAVQKFHNLAAPALLETNVLRLYGLRLNGTLIATLYALVEQNIVYCYLQGFDPTYGHLSPGVQILAAVIDDAIREKKSAVDFLRGREAYKYAWGARDQETYRVSLRRRALQQLTPSALAA